MPKLAVTAQGLSKRYPKALPKANMSEALRGILERAWPFSGEPEPAFWALREVSFELEQGAALGVIGPNGAGKSTLLKILSRITAPTSGAAWLCGNTASLLEIGAGFHLELSGRENIFLNGALLGLRTAEIRRSFEAIVALSGVGGFLDMPVKRYSSGMVLRLAFAVAIALKAEILLLDEVLAVGDADFQALCHNELLAQREKGRTLIYVSHSQESLRRLTDRTLWLAEGRIVEIGPTKAVLAHYSQSHA